MGKKGILLSFNLADLKNFYTFFFTKAICLINQSLLFADKFMLKSNFHKIYAFWDIGQFIKVGH